MGRPLHVLWHLIIDLIGPRNKWPHWMPKLWWKNGTWDEEDRFKVTVFIYVNGLPPDILYEWCDVRKLLVDDKARHHIARLLDLFDNDPYYHNKYWSYNIAMGVRQYCNGQTRHY